MPTITKRSTWRNEKYDLHGKAILRSIQRNLKPQEAFNIKYLLKSNKITCISHLADSTQTDILTAVCVEAVKRGELNRRGRFYFKKAEK